jgi:hypothetical protein
MSGRHPHGFARKTPRAHKASAGRTRISETPLQIRLTGVDLPAKFRPRARLLLGRRLGRFATHIERASVRFEDVNGPRGGVDTVCRIQLAVSHRPTVLAERRAVDAETALKLAAVAVARALERSVGRAGMRTLAPTRPLPASAPKRRSRRPPSRPAGGSLIGRRVGRARGNLADAAHRPEKERRDAWVDTALPGTSATDRKAGGGSSAARNTKLRRAGMGSTLEDSATRPSRKSTRKSANRAKSGSKQGRRERRKLQSTKARASRAKVQRQRGSRVSGR